MVFVDETGCSLLPAVGRTDAPSGRTPRRRATLPRDHRSLIGAVTLDGRSFVQGQDRSLRSTAMVDLLNPLVRHIPGTVLMVWDGAAIHYGAVKAVLRRGAATRGMLVRLPRYAPERNPVEGLWHSVKQVEVLNVCCHTLAELRQEVRNAVARVRHCADVLAGCIRQPGWY